MCSQSFDFPKHSSSRRGKFEGKVKLLLQRNEAQGRGEPFQRENLPSHLLAVSTSEFECWETFVLL